MRTVGKFAPATMWRAFFVAACLPAALHGGAAPATPPELAQIGRLDAAETAALVQQFRRAGIAGEFFLRLQLLALPRKGVERTYDGRLWGGRNDQGTIFRLELTDAAGATHRLLIQNGERPAVWKWDGTAVVQLDVGAWFEPLLPGLEITAFDLQMPFLYWPAPAFDKIVRMLGRPSHAVVFRPPPGFAAPAPGLGAVRAYLDTQYNALFQTELIDASGAVAKTFSFLALKRIGDQHVPKQADYRNERTRDKTRLQVTGAALNLRLPAELFASASLARDAAPPAEGLVRIDP